LPNYEDLDLEPDGDLDYERTREYKVTVERTKLPDSDYYTVLIDTDEGERLGWAEGRTIADAAHSAFARCVGEFYDD
jgi:hypothetical protein